MFVCRQFPGLDVGFYDFRSDIGNRIDVGGAENVSLQFRALVVGFFDFKE